MDQRRRYKNPPIEEALCEFRFAPTPDWDFTIPGKLQTALGDEYCGKPREQMAVEVGLQVHEGKPANLQYGEGLAKIQLVTKEGTRLVGVGPDTLSIHMLRPYQNTSNFEQGGWAEFEPRIVAALEAYRNITEPSNINRVVVRYINKIAIPLADVGIEDYIKCVYLEIEGLPEHYSNFMGRIEYVYDENTRLALSYGLLGTSLNCLNCLLDLDVIWQREDAPIEWKASLVIANDLHERAGLAFEAIVTDKARELFDAE